jgi:hypothetical protein
MLMMMGEDIVVGLSELGKSTLADLERSQDLRFRAALPT